MPTLATAQYPRPKDADEFEDMVLAAAKLRFRSSQFERNGRSGQAQDGVDVFGQDQEDRSVGLQAKNTTQGVSFGVVTNEVEKAERFTPPLDVLFIATTAPRDQALQKQVRQLSKDRKEADKFGVSLMFWDDIVGDLSSSAAEIARFFPQFGPSDDRGVEHDRILFEELKLLLPTTGPIRFIGDHNMAGFSFASSRYEPFREFFFEWDVPEREFMDHELEKLRQQLWNAVSKHYDLIATNTFSVGVNADRQSVPAEWEYQQPERFKRVVGELHECAGQIVEIHRKLIRRGQAVSHGTAGR